MGPPRAQERADRAAQSSTEVQGCQISSSSSCRGLHFSPAGEREPLLAPLCFFSLLLQ